MHALLAIGIAVAVVGAIVAAYGIHTLRHPGAYGAQAASDAGGAATARSALTIAFGAYLVLVGAIMALGTMLQLAFAICVPLGSAMVAAGIAYASAPARYRMKVEGVYQGSVADTVPRDEKLRRLTFHYSVDGVDYTSDSQDDLRASGIAQRYAEGKPYVVWVNARKRDRFRCARFDGFVGGLFALIVGAALVAMPFLALA